MNWRSIKHLTEDDYDKPLLFRMPGNNTAPLLYFVGEINNFGLSSMGYLDNIGYPDTRYVMSVERIPPETHYLRIDEIKG